MKAARRSTGKRKRFEILKRDGFRCAYCGSNPLQTHLRVDHVVPVVEGGTDDPTNLITACHDCNAGKAGVPLERKKYAAPDPEAARDHAEQIRQYLEFQKEIRAAKEQATWVVAEYWQDRIGPLSKDMFHRLTLLLGHWPHEKLFQAIDITAGKMGDPGSEYRYRDALNQAKYFSGILRKWREAAATEGLPEPGLTGS